jgi:hypothetical protein
MIIKFRGRRTTKPCPAGVEGWTYKGGGKIVVFEIDSIQCRECEYHKGHINKPKSGCVECTHPKLQEERGNNNAT